VCALLLGACSLDERTLHGASSSLPNDVNGEGGSNGIVVTGQDDSVGGAPSSAGGAPGTGGGSAATSGEGGATDSASPPPPDGWTFDHDIVGWQAEPDVQELWSATDFAASPDSGSLMVTNKSKGSPGMYSTAGSSECVLVTTGRGYDVAAEVFIAPGQSNGSGGFAIEFYDDAACQGALVQIENYLTATTKVWQRGERTATPAGARSALIRLVVSKLESDPPFSVLFDDVTFEAL
jgi:hypothetical protein